MGCALSTALRAELEQLRVALQEERQRTERVLEELSASKAEAATAAVDDRSSSSSLTQKPAAAAHDDASVPAAEGAPLFQRPSELDREISEISEIGDQ